MARARTVAIRARVSNQAQFSPIIQPNGWCADFASSWQRAASATTLAGAALDANTTCAGADHFVAAANRTGDPHKDAAKRYRHAVGRITGAVAISSRADGIIGRFIRDHVDHLFVAGAR